MRELFTIMGCAAFMATTAAWAQSKFHEYRAQHHGWQRAGTDRDRRSRLSLT